MDSELGAPGEGKKRLEERLRQPEVVPKEKLDPDVLAEHVLKGIDELRS